MKSTQSPYNYTGRVAVLVPFHFLNTVFLTSAHFTDLKVKLLVKVLRGVCVENWAPKGKMDLERLFRVLQNFFCCISGIKSLLHHTQTLLLIKR